MKGVVEQGFQNPGSPPLGVCEQTEIF